MNKLDAIIDELKRLSDGDVSNIPLPTDELLDEYEHEIGFCFPDEYKKVLKSVGNVFYGTIELLSVTRDKKYQSELSLVLQEARSLGVPKEWLPICEDNSNYYCLLHSGEVEYWSHDGVSNESWPDIASWIKDVWIDGN